MKTNMDEEERVSSPDSSGNESDASNESNTEDGNENDTTCIKTEPGLEPEPETVKPEPEPKPEQKEKDEKEEGNEKLEKEEKEAPDEKKVKKKAKPEAKKKEKTIKKRIKKPKTDKTVQKKRTSFFERRNIRKIRSDDAVGEATREALEAEKARLARVEARAAMGIMPIAAMEEPKEEVESDLELPIVDQGESPEELAAKRPRIESPPAPNFSDVIIVSEDDEEMDELPLSKPVIKPLRVAPPPEDPDIIDLEDSDTESLNDAGSHVNDDNNKHDEFGRVLVNVGHPEEEPDLYVAPQIAAALKPHQIGGIRFLYDNVIESTAEISKKGFGCILAHAMGLGKTIQIISLTDIALRLAKFKTILILVPINTIQNWISEFDRWLPTQTTFEAPPDADDAAISAIPDAVIPRKFPLYAITDSMKTFEARAQEVSTWRSKGGVLLVGYEMFRILVQRQGSAARRPKPQKRKKKKGADPEPDFIDIDKEEERAKMWDDMFTALVQPGPDMVIADEGHRIKNEKAEISQKVKNIETLRRVVLTGYPLQNNLEEYHCMVDFVRPNYLGSKMEFNNMFNRPITNGMCIDSTPEDRKLMYMRSHVLLSRLKGFVQRRSHKVLRDQLPEKTEYVMFLKMSQPQQNFYRLFMKSMGLSRIAAWAQNNPLKAFAVSVKIMNHPDILYNACTNQEKESIDDDFDGNADSPCSNAAARKPRPAPRRNGASSSGSNTISADFKNMFDENDDTWKNYSAGMLENSPKMVVFFDLLEAALLSGERVLAFTQSLSTLDTLEAFLSLRQIPDREEKWARNVSYYRLDGSTPASERDRMIKAFNDPEGTASLFLLSTRAGCLGINLTAANRVIVFDASWNPCHDCQAVCRVFRYGQTRPCFVYRLIMDNTIERKIYERQVKKQSLSVRVVDETTPDQHFTRQQLEVLLAFEDRDLDTCSTEQLRAVHWSDPILEEVLVKNAASITQMPFTHESLLIDKREFHLTTKEKKEALKQYENAKKEAALAHGIDIGLGGMARQSYANFYPRNGGYANPLLNPRDFRPTSTVMQLHKVLENARRDHHQRRQVPMQKGKLAPLAPAPSGMNKPPYYGGVPPHVAAKMAAAGMTDLPRGGNGRVSRRNDSIFVKEITIPHDVTTPASDGRSGIRIPRGTKVKLIQTEKGTYINHNNHMFALRSKLTPSSTAEPVPRPSPSQLLPGGPSRSLAGAKGPVPRAPGATKPMSHLSEMLEADDPLPAPYRPHLPPPARGQQQRPTQRRPPGAPTGYHPLAMAGMMPQQPGEMKDMCEGPGSSENQMEAEEQPLESSLEKALGEEQQEEEQGEEGEEQDSIMEELGCEEEQMDVQQHRSDDPLQGNPLLEEEQEQREPGEQHNLQPQENQQTQRQKRPLPQRQKPPAPQHQPPPLPHQHQQPPPLPLPQQQQQQPPAKQQQQQLPPPPPPPPHQQPPQQQQQPLTPQQQQHQQTPPPPPPQQQQQSQQQLQQPPAPQEQQQQQQQHDQFHHQFPQMEQHQHVQAAHQLPQLHQEQHNPLIPPAHRQQLQDQHQHQQMQQEHHQLMTQEHRHQHQHVQQDHHHLQHHLTQDQHHHIQPDIHQQLQQEHLQQQQQMQHHQQHPHHIQQQQQQMQQQLQQPVPPPPPTSLGHQDPLSFDAPIGSDMGPETSSLMPFDAIGPPLPSMSTMGNGSYSAGPPMYCPEVSTSFTPPFMHNMFYQSQGLPPMSSSWSTPPPLPSMSSVSSMPNMYPYSNMAGNSGYFDNSMLSSVPPYMTGCHPSDQPYVPSTTTPNETVTFNGEPHLGDRPREQPVHM